MHHTAAGVAAALGAVIIGAGTACGLPKVTTSPVNQRPPSTSPSASASSAPAAPPATRAAATVGDTLDLTGNQPGEEVAVTLVRVADPTQPTTDVEQPVAGNRLVGVQLRLANLGTAVYRDSPSNSAVLVDSDGQSFPTTLVTGITAGPEFPAGETIASGDSGLGYVVFTIPIASTVAKVQFRLDSGFANQTGQWTVPASHPAPAAPAADPASVVTRYFAAINAYDYQTAWSLGGKNLASSYDEFAAGFATTRHDTLTITSTNGGTVAIALDAEQTDGSHRYYGGTYTVSGGVITGADVSER